MSCIIANGAAPRARLLRQALATAVLAGALGPVATSAQDQADASRYEIEVIVFENLEEAPGDPRAEVTTRVGGAARAGADEAAGPDAADEAQPSGQQQARRSSHMDSAELQLEKAWSRLEKADKYRPLIHRAWTQPAGNDDADRAVRLRSDTPLQPLPAEVQGPVYPVDGTVELIQRRYLHLRADLTLSEVEEAASAELGEKQQALWQPLGPQRAMTRYRLSQSRRIETGTLTYFDHPRFGLLVEVRPAAQEQAETDTDSDPNAEQQR